MRHVFPCGTPALDFVGTLQARRAPVPIERIASPGLLDSWFVESGLLDLDLDLDLEPGSGRADLRAAVALPEAIYALVGMPLAGRPLPAVAVAAVNRQAASVPVTMCLGATGTSRHGTAGERAGTGRVRGSLAEAGGEEVGELVDGEVDALALAVEVHVAGAREAVQFLGAGGALVGLGRRPGGEGAFADDLEDGARRDEGHGVEDVAGGQLVDALPGQGLGGALVAAAGAAAVLLPALDAVFAVEDAGFFGGVREHGQDAGVLAAGRGGAGAGGGVEEILEDRGVLGAGGTVAELAGGFGGGDGADGLDAVVSAGGGEGVAAAGADAEQADALGTDLVPGGEVGDGGLEVHDALGGVLQITRQAAATSSPPTCPPARPR